MSKVCTIAWVHGVVQGVGFRYSTQREAVELGLTGYARNRDDGSGAGRQAGGVAESGRAAQRTG